MVGVAVGAWLTAVVPTYYGPVVAALAAFCVCAAGNCHNDLRDIAIDRINRPGRVLVRDAVSTRTAALLAALLYLAGLVLGLAVNRWVFGMVLTAVVLMVLYNVWAKRVPLLGNVIISALGGMLFITGGLAVDPQLAFILPGPLVPAVLAFGYHLVREMVKDVQDIEGDRAAGIRTFPQVVGIHRAMTVVLVLFLLFVLMSYVPVYERWYGSPYKVLAVYVVDLPLLALLIVVWGYPTPRLLSVASTALKAGMGIGLAAILWGAW